MKSSNKNIGKLEAWKVTPSMSLLASNICYFFSVIKLITGLKTWIIESVFVFLILSITAFVSDKGYEEWIAVFAVFFTFSHASVADRMEQEQKDIKEKSGNATVDCYKFTSYYFYAKEVLWFLYFFLVGSYSALAGVVVFLFYGWWRKTWRTFNNPYVGVE